jgi:hypothetical protein
MALLYLSAFSSEAVSAISKEIESASPRAGTLVASAFVESHLEHLIRSRMTDDKKVLDGVFVPSSVLGSFSAKINIGYLMKIYSKNSWKELHIIRDIRNDFAHELDISYDTPTVKDRCSNLALWERHKLTVSSEEKSEFVIDLVAGDPTTPYGRYQSACRFFIAVLSLLTNHPHQLEV